MFFAGAEWRIYREWPFCLVFETKWSYGTTKSSGKAANIDKKGKAWVDGQGYFLINLQVFLSFDSMRVVNFISIKITLSKSRDVATFSLPGVLLLALHVGVFLLLAAVPVLMPPVPLYGCSRFYLRFQLGGSVSRLPTAGRL